ncbi:MAG: serine O-acetyltransferase [Bacteroidales bacterium]
MTSLNHSDIITSTVKRLSESESYKKLCHQHREGEPLPSGEILADIISLARSILFPGFFGNSSINTRTLSYHIGVKAERLYELLVEQILAGLCYECTAEEGTYIKTHRENAKSKTAQFIERLPLLRDMLATDVEAAYNGDPAAQSFGEVILCYPAIRAITNYRIAHELHLLGVPLIPRMITEMAHSETGIDIHPAATIGDYFTIDHGTGVVIGATAIIGRNVKLFQGVTLGAKSFPLDDDGNPIKGIPRHPIIEDNVVIYSNATILGRITIGEGATIGGNIWVTDHVAKGAIIAQSKAKK